VILITTGADPHGITWWPPCRAYPLPVYTITDPGTDYGAYGLFPPTALGAGVPLICHVVTDPGGDPGAYGWFTPSALAPIPVQQVAGPAPPIGSYYPPSFTQPLPIILV
jgi:hypothetical protein